jgi:hypothetical protein
MANKRLDELEEIVYPEFYDFIAIHDFNAQVDEKLKKIEAFNFQYHKGNLLPGGALGIVCRNIVSVPLISTTSGVMTKVSAGDLLISVKGGYPPYLYSIKKSGGVYTSSINPNLASVTFNCGDVGAQTVYVRVSDTQPLMAEAECVVIIQDTAQLCT